jgi:predicted ATPase
MDRITRVRISNVRAIASVDLELSPFTVLIGENGSCKSTIVECLELLHKAADPSFFKLLYDVHRGMPGLLRKGAATLGLGVTVGDDTGQAPPIDYDFVLVPSGAGASVLAERLLVSTSDTSEPVVALNRTGADAEVLVEERGVRMGGMDAQQLAIGSFGRQPPHKAIDRLLAVLTGVEVHLHFDTVAAWAARSYQFSLSMRGSTLYRPADRLSLLGFNFANAWAALKNMPSDHWNETIALVRLGIGDGIDTVNVEPDAGGGNVAVSIRRSDMSEPIPCSNLSDGQLSWLAFVAMARLNDKRSLLAIDEPELHLHPSLLGRVVSLLSSLDTGAPVVLSTHSDRVLELLDDPAEAVRVCGLEGSRAVVSRIDANELPKWLERFGDLGQLRASGYLPRVLRPRGQEGT